MYISLSVLMENIFLGGNNKNVEPWKPNLPMQFDIRLDLKKFD